MYERLEALAKVIVEYSLEIKPGQLLRIKAEPVAEPLVAAVFKQALMKGAHVSLDILMIDIIEFFFKNASDEQLKFVSPFKEMEVDRIDAYLGVWGTTNTKYLSGVDPIRQQLFNKSMEPVMNRFFKRAAEGSLRWSGTQFPTQAHAQDAEMSLAEYEDFVYQAGHLHEDDPVRYWRGIEKEQARIVKILDQVDQVRVRAEGTDLTLRTGGRKWINCCGKENFPDGEIFTSPIEDSVSGTVRFSFPAFLGGREADGVRLTFKKGEVVEATARKNEDFLTAMVNTDEGSRRLGEFAVGTNYEITKFTRNTLFDEKIGGTFHMALGAAYPETGGNNRSGIHWDMVCDLKTGGEIEADGKTIYRNGKFVI
jgi:aminopeptidase